MSLLIEIEGYDELIRKLDYGIKTFTEEVGIPPVGIKMPERLLRIYVLYNFINFGDMESLTYKGIPLHLHTDDDIFFFKK